MCVQGTPCLTLIFYLFSNSKTGIILATSHHHLNQRILFSVKLTSPTIFTLYASLTILPVAELNAVARADGVRSLFQNPDNTLLLSVSLLGYSQYSTVYYAVLSTLPYCTRSGHNNIINVTTLNQHSFRNFYKFNTNHIRLNVGGGTLPGYCPKTDIKKLPEYIYMNYILQLSNPLLKCHFLTITEFMIKLQIRDVTYYFSKRLHVTN